MNFLVSVAAFLGAISVLVAVHEFGHYWAARSLGVRVLRFSIGFGRPVWMRRAGADRTEYCLSAIPLGGYVKLLDERDCPVALHEQARAFNRQPIPSRILILVAGPALNFLFAIVAYWAMFMVGVPGTVPVIGDVESGSLADRAGLASGDQIIAIGGRNTTTWESALVAMLDGLLDTGGMVLTVRGRDEQQRQVMLDTSGRASELTEPGRLFPGLGFRPWAPELPPVLGEVLSGGAAERAGLQPGDRILSANGEAISTWPAWVDFVRSRPGETVSAEVGREGQVRVFSIQVEKAESRDGVIGRIGAAAQIPDGFYDRMRALERYAALPAAAQALDKTLEMSRLTLRMMARMITGDVSVKNISGPINIAQYAGYSASIGIAPFLSFLAVVSISLGILNLLPVPMLDGGQIVYQLVEAAKGSPLSERWQLVGQQVGIFLLLILMSFAFYNDITRLLG